MIDDMLTPCEWTGVCDEIGDVRCMFCTKTYCERHIIDHECVVEDEDRCSYR